MNALEWDGLADYIIQLKSQAMQLQQKVQQLEKDLETAKKASSNVVAIDRDKKGG